MPKINELYQANAFSEVVQAKFHSFLELEQYLGGDERKRRRALQTPFVWVDYIEALNVDVVTFNTAVLSTGGLESFAKDERNLVIPEYAVIDAVKALTPGSLKIFMTHHPLGMMSEQTARYLEGEFQRHAHIHLFGHMHDPQPRSLVGLKGDLLSQQAGAIFTARKEYYIGYSLITLDRQNNLSETLIRSYFKDRDAFDEGIDVVEGGRWYPNQVARQHFRKIATPVDEAKLRQHLSGPALQRLDAEEAAEGGQGDLHSRFVAPPLRLTSLEEVSSDESRVEVETPVSFDEVLAGDGNIILHARPEYGRTTILRELRYQLLRRADAARFPRLPALIDFKALGPNADAVLRLVRAQAELAPADHEIEGLLKLGHVCVFVDDVQFSDHRRMKVLREFVERYPKARYILSSPQFSAIQYGAHVDPEMPVRFDFVELCEFRRKDMRQLLAKFEQCTDVEDWLDRLQNEFREINLPFTAANGSILMEILAEKHNFTPINRAVLLEQFVDSTLRKAAIEQSRRETFDYTNKTDLLAYLASWMARNDEYVPAREEVRSAIRAYIDERGLIVSIDDLMREFFAARIFVLRADDRVSFRYRAVLEYFIALRMTSDPAFKDWVMEEDRYLRYVNEIQYYAGKHRNDASLVDLIGQRYEKILDEAVAEIGQIDFSQLDYIALPAADSDQDLSDAAAAVAAPPLSKEEKDAELEADIPKDAEDRQEVFRPAVKEASDRFMLSLILFSGLLKNMELISDAEKRRHLSVVWRGWSTLLIGSLRIAPRIAKERRLRVNGVLYEVSAPHGMSDATLLRKMMLNIPHVHVRMLANSLGTEKLERQLTEPRLEDGGEPKIFTFLRTGVISELRLNATPDAVKALVAHLRENHYLLWSFVVHLGELRRLDRIRKAHGTSLELPVATAVATLRGGSHQTREDNKRKELTRLSRERILLLMKRDGERKS